MSRKKRILKDDDGFERKFAFIILIFILFCDIIFLELFTVDLFKEGKSNPKLKFEGNITIGNYTFVVVNKSYSYSNGTAQSFGVLGWVGVPADLSDVEIFIVNNLPMNDIKNICNHELSHVYWRWDVDNHETFKELDSISFKVCDEFVREVMER